MLYCIVLCCVLSWLYCILFYCVVLCCIVLYCIVSYCIVLYCIVLYCIVLYCIVLFCPRVVLGPYIWLHQRRYGSATIVLYCIVLYCIVLYCIVLYCNVLHCIALHCIALHCIASHCIVLYCIVLYCIVLYCIVLFCSQVLEWFWALVSGFTREDMARLLQFTTGCSQLPLGGFAELCPKFQITAAPTYGTLPTAHTWYVFNSPSLTCKCTRVAQNPNYFIFGMYCIISDVWRSCKIVYWKQAWYNNFYIVQLNGIRSTQGLQF